MSRLGTGLDMVQFVLALVVFIAAHSIPALPGLRARLVARFGRRGYQAGYSALSVVLLGWLVYATLRMGYVPLWGQAPWQAWVTIVLTPIGLFLLIAGLISPNPLSVSMRHADAAPGAVVAITRHPVLWGFALWAGSHIVPNGELRAVLLFGALLAFALVGIATTERRAKKRLGAQWAALASTTSIVPLAAVFAGRARLRLDNAMVLSLLVTLLVSGWLLAGGGHLLLMGVDPMTLALG